VGPTKKCNPKNEGPCDSWDLLLFFNVLFFYGNVFYLSAKGQHSHRKEQNRKTRVPENTLFTHRLWAGASYRAVSEFLRKGRTMKRKDPQEAVIGLFLFMSFSVGISLSKLARYSLPIL
jgi:hypothetical protein